MADDTKRRFSLFALVAVVTLLCVSMALLRIGSFFTLLAGVLMLDATLGGIAGYFVVDEHGFFTGAVWGVALTFVLPLLLLLCLC